VTSGSEGRFVSISIIHSQLMKAKTVINLLNGEPILSAQTASQYLARYWFAVCVCKIGSPVRRFIINRVPPAGGTADLRCQSMRLRLMSARSLTRRKPRGRSGLHSTPGLATTVLTRRLAPSVVRGLARTVPGAVPRRCTPGFHRSPPQVRAISPVIYPFPTLRRSFLRSPSPPSLRHSGL
jgi:hypothetical protein